MTTEDPPGRDGAASGSLRWGLRLTGLVLQLLLTTVLFAWAVIEGPALFTTVAVVLWLAAIAVLVLAVHRRRGVSGRGGRDRSR